MNDKSLLQILESLLNGKGFESNTKFQYQYLDDMKISELQRKCSAKVVPTLQRSDFLEILTENSCERNSGETEERTNMKEMLLNAICNPESVENIRKHLLKKFTKTFEK